MNSIRDTLGDIGLGALPRVPWDRRFGIDSVTPDELTAALGPGVPGARVVGLGLERDRGTTDRGRIAIEWNDVGTAAGLPTKAFVKGTPSLAASRILNSAFGLCATEVHFYNNAYEDVADITLRPYFARVGRGGRFVILLESRDPADTDFYRPDSEAPLEHAEAIIDALAKMHARFYQSPRFATDLAWVTKYRDRPGQKLAPRIVDLAARRFFKKYDVPAPVQRLTRHHLANRPAFWKLFEALPPTLCHGDTHIGNTYRTADGHSGLFDWQEVHRCAGIREVPYFLSWAFTPDNRRAHEQALLARYLDGLGQHGVPPEDIPGAGEAWELYRLFTVDSWQSVWASLGLMKVEQEGLAEELIARQTAMLLDLDVADALTKAV